MKYNKLTMIFILTAILLTGCTQPSKDKTIDSNTNDITEYSYNESFNKIVVENTSDESNHNQYNNEDVTIFKPADNIDNYYSNVINNEKQENTDSIEKYTQSDNINLAINKIKDENSFERVQILDNWHDILFDMESYYVLFDENRLFCLSEKTSGDVLINENDYQYYLEE